MSLFRTIFAFGKTDGRRALFWTRFSEVPSSCLRRAFVLGSLPEAEERWRQAQGSALSPLTNFNRDEAVCRSAQKLDGDIPQEQD